MDMPVLPVCTGLGAFPEADTMPECGYAAATVSRSEAFDWSVTDHKWKYANCFDVRRCSATFSDGRNAIMQRRRGV